MRRLRSLGAARFRRYFVALERNDADAVRGRFFRVRPGQRHFREPVGVFVDRNLAAVRIAQIFVVERGESVEIAERGAGNFFRGQRSRRLSERGFARRQQAKRKERNDRRRARLANRREKRAFAEIDGRKPRVVDRVKIGGRAGVKPHSFRTFAMRPENNTVAVGVFEKTSNGAPPLRVPCEKKRRLGRIPKKSACDKSNFLFFRKNAARREDFLKLEN